MAKYKLYSEVQLAKNIPELGFISGDVATIVDIIHSKDNQPGYCLEFFDNHGKTIDVAIVKEEAIQNPIEHGVVNYREYQHSQA